MKLWAGDRGRGVLARAALLALMAAIASATGAVARENYALIVAASDYPNLPQQFWLKGPKDDAALVRDYLLHDAPVKFEPQNVVTLASGDGFALATHQNILDQLGAIAAKAKPGDFVFLQFSGHGSQQPALDDPSEQDGKDEIFLSADTEMASPANPNSFPNALTDNEVGTALTAIRKTGAFVWVIFDSCHSGTMTRGAPDGRDVVVREIKPRDLGMPDSVFSATPAKQDEASRTAPLPIGIFEDGDDPSEGGLVGFFAAQTNELAPEENYDVPAPDGTTTQVDYGVFTHTIFSVLAKNPNITYRQLAQSVLAGYVADNWLRVTPLFQGRLDAPVFGSNGIVPTQQWPVIVATDGSLSVSAGEMQGLAAGASLLMVPSPASADSEALGVMTVSSATELRAALAPAADTTHPLLAAGAVPVGAYARLATVQYPFELRVAKPDPAGADPTQVAAVDDALAQIAATQGNGLRLSVVDADAPADVHLAVMSESRVAGLAGVTAATSGAPLEESPKLWLLPASGEISLDPDKRPPSMAIAAGGSDAPTFVEKLHDTLVEIFRATGLSRLTAASTFGPRDFTLGFGLQQAGSASIDPVAPENTPIIRPKDRLYVDFANTAGRAVDLNLLYVDHDYGITLLCTAHLAQGDKLFQPLADIDVSDAGREQLVAVVNESGDELTNLKFLEQPGLGSLRTAPQPGLVGMIQSLAAGQATRSAPPRDPKVPRGAIEMVPFEVLPATGAAAAADIPTNDPRRVEGVCTR